MEPILIQINNTANPAFGSRSPVNLNPTGEVWLNESGLKDYLDRNKDYFLKECMGKKETNPYEVQKHTFKLFDEINLDPSFEDKLKKFAFEKGTTMAVVRRVGGIYLRNLCLENFRMNKDEIDRHDPEITKN